MLNCDVISDLQVVYVSGEASAETRRLVQEHLATCAKCRAAFASARAIEKDLPPPSAQPANGSDFVGRARRLVFVILGGLFAFSAVLWAIFERVILQNYAGIPLPDLPGSDWSWMALAGLALLIYLLLLWRSSNGRQRSALVVGVAFLILGLLALQTIASGYAVSALAAFAMLALALVATFALLPRLPNVTLVSILALLVLNGLLFGRAVWGTARMVATADRAVELPGTLGHPGPGVVLDQAVRVDLRSLGLTWKKNEPVTSIDNVWIGLDAAAAQATYEGNGQSVQLTLVQLDSPAQADRFFLDWEQSISHGIHLMHATVHLPGVPGQGNMLRSYGVQAGKAYSAWQNENWVTIVEVSGTYEQAVPLAAAVKSAVAQSYSQGK